ncbi:hypothetical protein C8J56DRAFT_1053461 [Mycena floridula]|nr:hypothetical protein C8J56DRAFT_1053461 [Mycena floridula]
MSKDAAINYVTKYTSKSEKKAPAFPELLKEIIAKMGDNGTAQSACQKLLNKMLGERTYSAQETAYLLLGILLMQCSMTFQMVSIGTDGGMRELEQDVDSDSDGDLGEKEEQGPVRRVTGDSWIQRYMKRGPAMEELSLQQMLQQHAWRNGAWRKWRKTNVVVHVFPQHSPDPQGEQYDSFYRTKIILHHKFQSLNVLHHPDGEDEMEWPQLYTHCLVAEHVHGKDTLHCWEEKSKGQVDNEEEEDELVNPNIEAMDEDDWQIFAHDHPMWLCQNSVTLGPGLLMLARMLMLLIIAGITSARWGHISMNENVIPVPPISEPLLISPNSPMNRKQYSFTMLMRIPEFSLEKKSLSFFATSMEQLVAEKTFLIHAICQELRHLATENNKPDPI